MRCEPEYLAAKYQQNLFATALSITHNVSDAEDAVQETYLKYLKDHKDFESEEHIRAWLLRTTVNQSKDILRFFWHKNRTSMEDWMKEQEFAVPEDKALVEAVLSLPSKYSSVLHLYYYEEYSVRETAGILRISESAVKSRLLRGRQMLKKKLEEKKDG